MAAQNLLDEIEKRESGYRNVFNYKHGPGFSASGHFQIIDETWRRWARAAGIDISKYPRAIDAPYEVQRAVAQHGLQAEGTKPWKAMDNYKGGGAENLRQPPGVLSAQGQAPPPSGDGMPSGLGVGTAFGGGPAAAAPTQPAYDLSGHLVSGKDKSILQGVGSDLQSRFGRMIQEAPEDVRKQLQILSAYRSKEHQQRLWDASDKSGKMVARPGHSQHEHGNAFDLRYASPAAREYAHANAARYGLTFPMSYEPWHIETVEARGGAPWQAALPADAAQPPGVLAAAGPAPAPPDPVAAFDTAFKAVQDEQAQKAQAQQAQAQQAQVQEQQQQLAQEPQQQAATTPGRQATAAAMMTSLMARRRQAATPPPPRGLLWS